MKPMKLDHHAGGGRGSGLGAMLGASAAALVAVAGFSSGTAAQMLTTLHSFAGPPSDGATPTAGLIADAAGNLYGTTEFGGRSGCQSPIGNGCGIVFKLTRSGIETVLHSFTGSPGDGANPFAGLIAHAAGNLYGTTALGGASDNGTVFKLTPSGHETVLYGFAGSPSDGSIPTAGLIFGAAGDFYGTTHTGGAGGNGIAFKLTQSGAETVLHNFPGFPSDGAVPIAGLIAGADGNLYGTTFAGGGNGCFGGGGVGGCGTVFKLAPSGTETVLYGFAGSPSDGAGLDAGLIADAAGNFYGTTEFGGRSSACQSSIGSGCGTVFELTPPTTTGGTWTETVLYSFTGGSDGAEPFATLITDAAGNLYGTTSSGGGSGDGTVFKLAPPSATGGTWTETVLHSFAGGSDGAIPIGGLIADAAGNLYGTAAAGGSGGCGGSGCGTVFEIAGSGFVIFR